MRFMRSEANRLAPSAMKTGSSPKSMPVQLAGMSWMPMAASAW